MISIRRKVDNAWRPGDCPGAPLASIDRAILSVAKSIDRIDVIFHPQVHLCGREAIRAAIDRKGRIRVRTGFQGAVLSFDDGKRPDQANLPDSDRRRSDEKHNRQIRMSHRNSFDYCGVISRSRQRPFSSCQVFFTSPLNCARLPRASTPF